MAKNHCKGSSDLENARFVRRFSSSSLDAWCQRRVSSVSLTLPARPYTDFFFLIYCPAFLHGPL